MTAAPDPLTLSWQGAADRSPARLLLVRVRRARAEGRGWFGLGNSPALPGYMPDAHVVEAEVVAGGPAGQPVRLRVPGSEGRGIAEGDVLVVGQVDAAHLICLLRPPAGLAADAALAWAAEQPCGG